MSYGTLSVPWERIRPEVMVQRADGHCHTAMIVEHDADHVVVVYSDGRREEHAPTEQAEIWVNKL